MTQKQKAVQGWVKSVRAEGGTTAAWNAMRAELTEAERESAEAALRAQDLHDYDEDGSVIPRPGVLTRADAKAVWFAVGGPRVFRAFSNWPMHELDAARLRARADYVALNRREDAVLRQAVEGVAS